MSRLTDSPAWQALSTHARTLQNTTLNDLFLNQPERADAFADASGPLQINHARQRITPETLALLSSLATQEQLDEKLSRTLSGDIINNTEGRAACHNHLRAGQPGDDVALMRTAMKTFADDVHSARRTSVHKQAFTHLINVGIGGSDLGPRLVVDALAGLLPAKLECHFAANIDPTVVSRLMRECPPETTLVLVSSKSFGTEETRQNAQSLIEWLKNTLGEGFTKHLVAITANPGKALELGIEHSIAFPDWVGGRFSVWSAIGLPIALTYGFKAYNELLQGGESIDLDASTAIRCGLIDIWNRNFQNYASLAVLAYSERLRHLPAYLQQLFMESQGKQLAADGEPTDCATGMMLFGSQGTNGQHSFHQLLHQGSDIIPCDFLIALENRDAIGDQQQRLIANALAQSLALAQGEGREQVAERLAKTGLADEEVALLARHKTMPGNRPSTVISFKQVDAYHLGALIAFYEYRMLAASFIWGLNPFDQWGVELGKTTSEALFTKMQTKDFASVDAVSAQILKTLS